MLKIMKEISINIELVKMPERTPTIIDGRIVTREGNAYRIGARRYNVDQAIRVIAA